MMVAERLDCCWSPPDFGWGSIVVAGFLVQVVGFAGIVVLDSLAGTVGLHFVQDSTAVVLEYLRPLDRATEHLVLVGFERVDFVPKAR